MGGKTFKDYEREGFNCKAEFYDDHALPLTRQMFDPLIACLGNLSAKRILDLASGTGHFTARLADAGADVVGLDIAPNMVALAGAKFPNVRFQEGDAEALPFEDSAFDAVTCCFGLLHFEDLGAALAEIHRLLRPGGRLAFSVWCAPEQGSRFFGTIMEVVTTLADMDVDLPPAPPMFQLADPEITTGFLRTAGFPAHEREVVPIVWRADRPEALIECVGKATVRTSLILDHQAPDVRARILDTLLERARAAATEDGVALACPAVLIKADKPTVA